jgi:hypothetical protein
MFKERADWKKSVEDSDVRLQWDPDHAPNGDALARRAIQLGLRGSILEAFAKRELLEVIDLTDFVESQRRLVGADSLRTPVEHAYLPLGPIARRQAQLDS